MSAQKETGWSLGKYEVRELIGQGGFGAVYRAYDTRLEVERALKILHPALNSSAEFITRFGREARLVARIEHPHIVPVYDFGHEDARYFLVMKLMSGGSLGKLLEEQGALPFARVLEILRDMSEALDYAHSQDLVHRDIKPGNVLFEASGSARLGDFGFARALSGKDMSSLSLSGGLMGTPSYMAPELWRNRPASPASDVYSLGCMVTEMLTGEMLFSGESPAEIMTSHVLDGPQFPAQWPRGAPTALEAVLRKALERKPEDRYQAAGEFYRALSASQDKPPIDTKRGSPLPAVEQPSPAPEQLRAAEIEKYRSAAFAAGRAGEWTAAEQAVRRWLELAPADAEALSIQVELVRRRQEHAEEAQRRRLRDQVLQTSQPPVAPPPAASQPVNESWSAPARLEPLASTAQDASAQQPGMPQASPRKRIFGSSAGIVVLVLLCLCLVAVGMYYLTLMVSMGNASSTQTAQVALVMVASETPQPPPPDTPTAPSGASNGASVELTPQAGAFDAQQTITAIVQKAQSSLLELNNIMTATAEFSQSGTDGVDVGKIALNFVHLNWQQITFDGFDDNANGWDNQSESNEFGEFGFFIENGRYTWLMNAKQGANVWAEHNLQAIPDFYSAVDFNVVDVKLSGQSLGFGLVFRDNDAGYYIYTINLDGFFYVDYFNKTTNQWVNVLPWSPTSALSGNSPNHVAVLALEDKVWLFLNDQLIGQLENTLIETGSVSPAVTIATSGDSATVVFDNFELYVP